MSNVKNAIASYTLEIMLKTSFIWNAQYIRINIGIGRCQSIVFI